MRGTGIRSWIHLLAVDVDYTSLFGGDPQSLSLEQDSGGMTQATRQLLEQFEALPDGERSEVLVEVARRAGLAAHDAPVAEDFIAAADRLLIDLDRRES